MKLYIKRLLQILFISFICYFIYSNYRIYGTWIKIPKWHENLSVISFNIFKKDELFSLYSETDKKNQSFFAFGNTLFMINKNDYNQRIFPLSIFRDSLVINDSFREKSTYLKIPDSLKYSKEIKLNNKIIENTLRKGDSIFIDTTYFFNKYCAYKSKGYLKDKNNYDKWVIEQYDLKSINNYKILMFNFPGHAILKKQLGELYLYQITKDSIVTINTREIKGLKNQKKEIMNRIKRSYKH